MQIFKWEERKGHDVLLYAYLEEFSASDNVERYLKTAPFHSSSNFLQQAQAAVDAMQTWRQHLLAKQQPVLVEAPGEEGEAEMSATDGSDTE